MKYCKSNKQNASIFCAVRSIIILFIDKLKVYYSMLHAQTKKILNSRCIFYGNLAHIKYRNTVKNTNKLTVYIFLVFIVLGYSMFYVKSKIYAKRIFDSSGISAILFLLVVSFGVVPNPKAICLRQAHA